MRRVSSDPVPAGVVQAMLDAAVRSPSGGNAQNWRWLTVTDRQTVAALGALYAEGWEELNATLYKGKKEAAIASGDEATKRVLSSSQWLADNFDKVPLVVLPYHRNDPTGASIYPAVWSLMLAARGHGVGTTLTTILGLFKHAEVAELLGVPLDKGWQNAAAIPCGYPLGRWGVARRAPVHEVVYEEQWGTEPEWQVNEPVWEE
ncbi:MAG: nitroreductase family protein [Actinomycetota bacterium]